MSNDLITFIYSTDKINLGVTPLFYHWLREPLWQYMYNLFQPYSQSVIVVGLDTPENDNPLVEVKKLLENTKAKRVCLVDISLCLLSEETLNRILNQNYTNVLSIKREAGIVNLDGRNYESEFNRYLGLDIVDKNILLEKEIHIIKDIYDALSLRKNDVKLFSFPYEETFKLQNKKDAILMKYLSTL
jgi:hypothetical protein